MEIMLSFLLLNLFMFTTTHSRLYSSSNAIYDTSGNELQKGAPYYVLPILHGTGGGLTVSQKGKNACPLNVTQESFEVSQGTPFTFSPMVLDEGFVRASYPIAIESSVNTCKESSIWKVSAVGLPATQIVTTGGELNTAESCFQLVEDDMMPDTQSYQIQYCPFKCGSSGATLTCYNVGVVSDANGDNYLALTEILFPVVFANSFGKFTLSSPL